jgi:hypothetical protein
MANARATKRRYSPKRVDSLREKTVSSEDFDALIETELTGPNTIRKKTPKRRPATPNSKTKAIDGLSTKDVNELRDRKRRSAAARQRAKARSGGLVFK